jgi:hypothetical protein
MDSSIQFQLNASQDFLKIGFPKLFSFFIQLIFSGTDQRMILNNTTGFESYQNESLSWPYNNICSNVNSSQFGSWSHENISSGK